MLPLSQHSNLYDVFMQHSSPGALLHLVNDTFQPWPEALSTIFMSNEAYFFVSEVELVSVPATSLYILAITVFNER